MLRIFSSTNNFRPILLQKRMFSQCQTVFMRKILTWGNNNSGKLGHNDTKKVKEPKVVKKTPPDTVQISCGDDHMLALTESGDIYAWGNNRVGQLGLGDEKDTYAPYKMEPFSESKIVQVAAGGHHSAAINEDGEVFTWGWSGSLWKLGGLGHGRGKLGYLGYGIPENIKRPKKVEGLSGVKIVQIACGHHHTLALSDEGEIYSWGRGDWGRLGHGNNASVYTPLKIDPVQFQGQKIVKIAAGKQYSGAITEEGDLFMWGKNEQFQLGVQSMQNYLSGGAWDCYTSPIMLIIKDKRGEPYQIKEVACGEKVTSAITEDGKGYIWGGTIFEPEQFGGEVKFSAISCGRLHMGAVSKNKLYMYGSNWSNQLGDLKHTFVPPSNVEEEAHILEFPGKLIQFDCGGDYSAVLIEI